MLAFVFLSGCVFIVGIVLISRITMAGPFALMEFGIHTPHSLESCVQEKNVTAIIPWGFLKEWSLGVGESC